MGVQSDAVDPVGVGLEHSNILKGFIPKFDCLVVAAGDQYLVAPDNFGNAILMEHDPHLLHFGVENLNGVVFGTDAK